MQKLSPNNAATAQQSGDILMPNGHKLDSHLRVETTTYSDRHASIDVVDLIHHKKTLEAFELFLELSSNPEKRMFEFGVANELRRLARSKKKFNHFNWTAEIGATAQEVILMQYGLFKREELDSLLFTRLANLLGSTPEAVKKLGDATKQDDINISWQIDTCWSKLRWHFILQDKFKNPDCYTTGRQIGAGLRLLGFHTRKNRAAVAEQSGVDLYYIRALVHGNIAFELLDDRVDKIASVFEIDRNKLMEHGGRVVALLIAKGEQLKDRNIKRIINEVPELRCI